MLIFASFIQGIKNVWLNKFLIGIMFLFKLGFSLILLAPIYLMFSASFGTNVKASSLLKSFDFSLLIDFVYHWRQTLSIYFLLFFLVFFLAIMVFIFLSGGFWGILRDQSKKEERNLNMERFFSYCARYFWGMFKIALLLIVFYLIAFLLFLFFLSIFDSVAGKGNWLDITSWRAGVKISAFAFLFFLVNMIGDYLRIFCVQNFQERFSGFVKRAFRFLLTNIFKTLSLYYLLSFVLVMAILIFAGLNELMDGIPKTFFYVLLLFFLQQILSLFRSFYRLVYYSSQMVLVDKLLMEKETLS
ncbi:MAG: hypothetical protein AMJ73_02235 [candidate division Zixibacteria bacterium SM1_73]|nr:MAG: hypothetical protein AMJ73_02235 [candidate division Zixibacteria bacterium SM1_73]